MQILDRVYALQKKYSTNPTTKTCLEDCLQLLEDYNKFVMSVVTPNNTARKGNEKERF